MIFAIALNAVSIGFEADFQAQRVTQELPRVLGSTSPYRALDLIFSSVFMGELVLRLYVHRVEFLIKWETAVLWNWFDLAVVLMTFLQDAITLLAVTSSSAVDVSSMRLLRVLRVFKVLRIVRIVPLFAELRRIVSSIMGSFKSLGWTMALLFLMMYIVGIFFVQLITDHLVERRGEALTERELRMRKHFGSLPAAWLSLWKAISGGIDWDILSEPLEEDVGSLLGWAFAAYIAFALLALMNVVTGVFVQTALQSAQQEEDSFVTDQIIALLSSTQKPSMGHRDGRSLVTLKEIQSRLRDPRFERDWKSINVTQDEAEYIFELLDVTRCGQILVEDFVAACIRLHGGAKSIDVLTMMQENRHNSRRLEEVFTSTFELTDDVRVLQEGQRQLAHALEQQRRRPPSAGRARDVDIRRSLGKLESTASASALRMAALEEQLGSVGDAVKSVLRRSSDLHLLETMVETFVSGWGGVQAGTGGSEAQPKAAQRAPGGYDEEV